MTGAEERYATLVRVAGIDPTADISEAAQAELRALARHEGDRHEAVVELVGAIRAMAGARLMASQGDARDDARPAPGHGARFSGPS